MANHNSKLTDKIVLELRQLVRETRRLNIRANAEKYGVSHPTMHYALTGKTFQHLPGALTKDEYDHPGGGRIAAMTTAQIKEITDLRKRNPVFWSYLELAKHCNRLYGLKYAPSNVKRIIASYSGEVIARPDGAKSVHRNPNSNIGLSGKPKVAKSVMVKPVPYGMKVIDRTELVERLLRARQSQQNSLTGA